MRTTIAAALILGFTFACNDPQKAQENADHAQVQADQDKVKAQAEADRTQAEATADLTKAKNNYRSTLNDLLADLDKRTADLKATKSMAKAKDLDAIDQKLGSVADQRNLIAADVKTIDGAMASSWDSMKVQYDKDIAACRSVLSLGKS